MHGLPQQRKRTLVLTSLALATLLLPAAARDDRALVERAVARSVEQAVELRRQIHRHPELGNREHDTARLVADHLRDLGLEVQTGVAHTGVVALLRGTKPGSVVALRADMDALPVTESTDLPFKSTRRAVYLDQEVGVAHACGHDVHTAVVLGAASALASLRDQIPGAVKFIFQPAEEGPPPGERGGAELMLEEGALEDPRPEAIFALHAFPDLEVGQLGWAEGPTFAAVDQFTVKITGRQAHGAWPQLSIDPVVMAAQTIEALQTIRSRNLPPDEPAVVSVGIVRGGERFNIIPHEVYLEGTVRSYRPEVRSQVERRMREILDGITRAGGGSFELEYLGLAPALVNDPVLSRRLRPTLERVVGREAVSEVAPTMAGEDFAFFANEIPGFYFRLGVVKAGTESGGLHTPTFRADDAAVEVGMRAMVHLVLDYLGGDSAGQIE